jgi:integrase
MRRNEGKLAKVTLGRANGMAALTPDDAREMALGQASGKDEKPEKMTFSALWKKWLGTKRPGMRENTLIQIMNREKRLLAAFGGNRLTSITVADVEKYKYGMSDRKIAVNRDIQWAGICFNWGIASCGISCGNPFKKVKRFPEEQRKRILQGEELSRFLVALNAHPLEWVRDFFKLALLTGARKSNLIDMSRDQIDLARAVWTIPALSFKGKRDFDVPLLPPAIDIIRRRLSKGGEKVFKFNARNTPDRYFREICAAAGIAKLTTHDLRRTVGSAMAAQGLSIQVIAKVLGHANSKTSEIYSIIADGAARDAMASVQGVLTGGDDAAIIPDFREIPGAVADLLAEVEKMDEATASAWLTKIKEAKR